MSARRTSAVLAAAAILATVLAAGSAPARSQSFAERLAKRFPDAARYPLSWAHSEGEPVRVTQPDGRAILLRGTDMEVGGYAETLDGYSAIRAASGWWTYAVKRPDGTVVSSGRPITDTRPKDIPKQAARTPSVWVDASAGKDVRAQIYEALRAHQFQLQTAYEAAAAAGKARTFKIPALMLNTRGQFADDHTPEHFKDLLSGTRESDKGVNPRGTMTELYLEMSWGTFEPHVDVYGGPDGKGYISPKSMVSECYYGRKAPGDLSAPGPTGPPIEATVLGMAMEAVPQADPEVDFSQYDNDGDGSVDFLLIIHSGPGREATLDDCDIHSHYFGLATTVTADGVLISSAMTIPEVNLQIGVAAHEFMHALGEPDYYDTDGSGEGTGEWDLGGGGPWLGYPPQSNSMHFNPYMKVNLGWVKPRLVSKTTTGVTFRPRELYQDIVAVPLRWGAGDENDECVPPADSALDLVLGAPEFTPGPWCWDGKKLMEGYILEMNSRSVNGKPNDARLPRGAMFDRYSHSNGLMVWHFDAAISVNSDETHARVDLEEADYRDGLQDVATGLTRGDPGDLFYDDATGMSSATVAKDAPPGGNGQPQAVPEGSPWTVVGPPMTCQDVACDSMPGAQPVPQFTVTDDPDNVVLRVKLDWISRSADDWDLYVDHLVGGTWVNVASSAGGTDPHCVPLGDDDPPGCLVDGNPQSESTVILKPAPGDYRVRAINWAAPTAPTATVSVELQPTFAKGAMPNTLDWNENKSGWAFTNVRPAGDGVRVDLVKHTNNSSDLSPEIVRSDAPLQVGRAGTLKTRVFNHGGRATGPATVTVLDAGAVVGSKTVPTVKGYDFANVELPYTPATAGTHVFTTRVSHAAGEIVAGNNEQDTSIYVGDAGAKVLIVDDDQNYGLEESYTGLLSALGVPFAVSGDHPSLDELKRYTAVIWVAGSTQRKDSLNSSDREALGKYLDGGGRMLLTGSRVVYGVDLSDGAWFTKYFGAEFVGSWQFGRGPAKGLGQSFSLELAPGRPLLDELKVSGGTETFRLDPEGDEAEGTIGVRYGADKFLTEVQDFSIAQVPDGETRVAMLKSSLDRFGVKGSSLVAAAAIAGAAGAEPEILHSPWRLRLNGEDTPIVATVTGNPISVTLHYRKLGASSWTAVRMVESRVAGIYEAMIPGSAMTPDGLEYRIEAVNPAGIARSPVADGSNVVTSAYAPKSPGMKSIVSPGTNVKGAKTPPLAATGAEDQLALAVLLLAMAAAVVRRLRPTR